MKTLTLTQPWASLVALGVKTIETRSWATSHRGLLAIHAAKGMPLSAKQACELPDLHNHLDAGGFGARDGSDLPRGAIIATCRLAHVVPTESLWLHREDGWLCVDGYRWEVEENWPLGDFTPGRYAWLLSDVSPVSAPVPAKGSLGLWEWPR